MHELPITQSLLEITLSYAAKAENVTRVTDLYLVIGQFSSIIDESIQFYWDILSKDSICEGAQLHFERVPGTLYCLDCNQTFTLADELTKCPHCDSFRLHTVAGEEFRLDSIDVVQA